MVHQTGIRELDRKFGGGIPPGTLVAVEAPAHAQREPLLCAGADKRSTMYFTTVRSKGAIQKQFKRSPVQADLATIADVDPEQATETVPEALGGLSDGQDFIIDVVDPIEDAVDQQSYADFLNTLTERLDATDSVGYLHAYAGQQASRHRQILLDVADYVWKLVPVSARGKLSYRLEIPKTNGLALRPADRYLEIQIGADVDIDRTRNIG